MAIPITSLDYHPSAPQRPSTRRVVHVLPVRQLQCHLQSVAQVPKGTAPGESRLSGRAPVASCVVLEGLWLLPALSQWLPPGAEGRQTKGCGGVVLLLQWTWVEWFTASVTVRMLFIYLLIGQRTEDEDEEKLLPVVFHWIIPTCVVKCFRGSQAGTRSRAVSHQRQGSWLWPGMETVMEEAQLLCRCGCTIVRGTWRNRMRTWTFDSGSTRGWGRWGRARESGDLILSRIFIGVSFRHVHALIPWPAITLLCMIVGIKLILYIVKVWEWREGQGLKKEWRKDRLREVFYI